MCCPHHSRGFLDQVQIRFQYRNPKIHVAKIHINITVKLGSRIYLTLKLPVKSPRRLLAIGTIHQLSVLYLPATLETLKIGVGIYNGFKISICSLRLSPSEGRA